MYNMFFYSGGRFTKGSNGIVEYRGAEVKIAWVMNASALKMTLADLFHIGKKMELITGTPKRAWFVYPKAGYYAPKHLVTLKEDVDVTNMYHHARYESKSWVEVYLQDSDFVKSNGNVTYELPDEVFNLGPVQYVDEEIDEVVAAIEAREAAVGFWRMQQMEAARRTYTLRVIGRI